VIRSADGVVKKNRETIKKLLKRHYRRTRNKAGDLGEKKTRRSVKILAGTAVKNPGDNLRLVGSEVEGPPYPGSCATCD